MGVWTITYAGTEKSASDWGLNADPVLRYALMQAGQFAFTVAGGDPAAATPFPFEALVTIRQNRILAGGGYVNDGSAWHFTFQGRLKNPKGRVGGDGQNVMLIFKDAWDDLENIPLQQLWLTNSGWAYFCRLVLFYNPAYSPESLDPYLTVAQQLTNIITYAAAEAGANIQVGTITATAGTSGASQMPWVMARGLSCAAAIKKCLELFPDLIAWVDGSTTPPSFNCVPRALLTPVTFPWKGVDAAGREHDSSEIDPRYDLVPSQVVLQYQETASVAGATSTELFQDVWPAGSLGMALRSLVCPIDLRGMSATFSSTTITTAVFDPTNVAAFWQKHVPNLADQDIVGTPTLVDDTVNTGSAFGVTVKNAYTGAVVNLAGYNLVVGKSKIPAWTGYSAFKVWVTGNLSYTRARKVGTAATARTTDKAISHFHRVKVTLTNAPVGTSEPTAANTWQSGEVPVTGLAKTIYNSLNGGGNPPAMLQYDGFHQIIETVVTQIIGPWNVLNLTGGNPAWLAMNAQISSVEIDFFHNTTRLTIGPARHLAPQELNNYLQFFRTRLMLDSGQSAAGTQIGPSTDVAGEAEFENGAPGTPQSGLVEHRDADSITGTAFNGITLDPANGQIQVPFFDATGTVQGTALIVQEFPGNGVPAAGTLPGTVNFRVGWRYRNTATTPHTEYVCTTAGTNSTSAWTQIGGGGGGGMNYRGYWLNTSTYAVNDVVVIQSGISAGLYISLIASNTNNPAGGTGWQQLAGGNSVGAWS